MALSWAVAPSSCVQQSQRGEQKGSKRGAKGEPEPLPQGSSRLSTAAFTAPPSRGMGQQWETAICPTTSPIVLCIKAIKKLMGSEVRAASPAQHHLNQAPR